MKPANTPLSPKFVNLHAALSPGHADSPLDKLSKALLASSASVEPKYFYDPLGSKLFEAITALEEYYPTRTEAAILDACRPDIARALAKAGIEKPCLIDLGAGNCAKAMALIPHLQPSQYVPIDISVDFLQGAAEQVQAQFPALDILGLGMDFSGGLNLPDLVQDHDRVYFYPGSSLGNFSPDEALKFLQGLAEPARGRARGLLLGIDLVKDIATLEAAYDDALGVTAAFNKNLLLNLNAQLGANFDVRQWRHVALFNRAQSRIEMHLEALCDTSVRWQANERRFTCGERIHTESSYKYTLPSMTALLRQAGFNQVEHWSDTKGWFGVFWAAV